MTDDIKPASQFVAITGFRTHLNSTLARFDKQLPIDISPTLKESLKTANFTFMTIRNQVDTEVVKVYLFDNKVLIERGQDGTKATAFPKGSCVDADPTWAGIKELICSYECCEDRGGE
ncbi:hypothetical protein V757_02230 [Pelistega indica]|uniref:Uncharacterized protein n=1 Tax=Pelistega indica TaxID=1414851 RepID=V8GA02_9BURK|nr:hypothetical protein [Pelistega indica]ETD72778.1 hypothetical protein V757_02230 [Pelistega indica]